MGDDQSGSIAVTSAVSPAQTATLHLRSKESITGGRITVDKLVMTAGAAIDVTTDVGTVASTSGTDTTIRELDDLVIGAVNGEVGVTTGEGSIFVETDDGKTDTNRLLTVAALARVTANGTGKDVRLQSDRMAINADVTALDDRVTLVQQTDDRPINLGTATSATTLDLSSAELDRVTAGVLQVGDDQSGSIAVTSTVAPANAVTLHLRSKESITGGRIAVNKLAMTAGTGIDVTTDVGTVASTSGSDTTISERDDLVIGAVNGEVGVTTGEGSIFVETDDGKTDANRLLTVAALAPVTANGTGKDVRLQSDLIEIEAYITALDER